MVVDPAAVVARDGEEGWARGDGKMRQGRKRSAVVASGGGSGRGDGFIG